MQTNDMKYAILAVFVLSTSMMSHAQEYPHKAVRLVTSEAGGSTDFSARVVAQGITGPLGQPVIVDNRGAGGSLSTEIVGNASPDGYTVLVTGSSFWGAPLMRKTSYDPVRDFSPISLLVNSPNILVVPPSFAAKSVKELIDMAKAKPGQLNYGSGSSGSSIHLAGELFKSLAGVNIVYVPYKGSGPALNALMGAQVQMMFATAPSVAPLVRSGKLRGLAVSSPKPSALYPDLPTIAATVPGYEIGGATAMFAPRGTPAAIVNRLNLEVVKMLGRPEVAEKFLNAGSEVVASSPGQLAASMKSDMARLGKVIREAGLKLD